MAPGILLERLTWKEAEEHLTPDAVIVIPLGAATKEHGLHLQLRNDFLLAEYLKDAVLENTDAIVMPTINYSYYPAFIEYPGSVSLSSETTSQMVFEICESMAAFGPRKFYIINTGISTLAPLKHTASNLHSAGILLHYTDLHEALAQVTADIGTQEGGSHADEIETSMMLKIAPDTVRMDLASRDFEPGPSGRLTRLREPGLAYSPSGVWGDATLATKDKGEIIVKCLVGHVLADIENLRNTSE
jgi:creatinine amidohydrolase